MTLAYLVLGIFVLAIGVVDLLWTTIWVEGGAGPLTSRLMAGAWAAIRRAGSLDSRLLTLAGPVILVLGLTTWIALLWAGWTLVFASGDGNLVDTVDGRPVAWPDLIYVTGYTIFTLGNGDFVPRGGVWQLATTLATASGMLFVTLSVTYVLSVLQAVTQKRSFASGVSGLGPRSVDVVRTGWAGDSFRGLEVPITSLATQLDVLTSNHKAYPILHYFYSRQSGQASTTSVAVLDETLTLLRFGVAEEARPSEILLTNARSSVGNYLETVYGAFIESADRPPSPPDVDALRDAGIPTVSDRQFAESMETLDERRRTLLGLVESDARRWPEPGDA